MDTQPFTPGQIELAGALESLISWMRQSREPFELSASAISALTRLEQSEGIRVTDLARREGFSQPGVTTLINRLSEAGLVARAADPSDGRVVLVSLTPAGRERLRAHRTARTELIARQIDRMSPEDRQTLLGAAGALRRFIAADD